MRTLGIFATTVCLAGVSTAQPAATDKATISFLHTRRNPDGGYAPGQPLADKPLPSSLRATASALRALKYLHGEPEQIDDTKRFVKRCYNSETGGFGDAPGVPPTVFSTAVGATAAAELKLPASLYRDGA